MKQKQKCGGCNRDYFTSMVKVYVFKKHTCPDDRTDMVKSEGGTVFTCPKCNRVFSKTVPAEWNSMGVRVEGSTQSFEAKEKYLLKEPNVEIQNVMVPDQPTCQQCRNYQTRAAQAERNREKKIAKGISDDMKAIPDTVTDADIYRYEVFRKTQEDFQERQKAEAYKKQQEERAAAEIARKKALEAQMKASMLPTKEEMQPLIEPEMLKIEQEAEAKDIRIEEMKKRAEEEKKLKADLKKQNAKIAKLKKKLEEEKEKEAKVKGAVQVLNGEHK